MLFLLLRAEFVAAAQVVVYAGAVMVLYVFVVAYVGGAATAARPPAAPGCARSRSLFARGAVRRAVHRDARLGPEGDRRRRRALRAPASARPAQIGKLLLTRFLLPFEVASFLLLVAAVGAVVLARRRGGLDEDDDEPRRIADSRRCLRPRARARWPRASAARRPAPTPSERGPPSRRRAEPGEEGGW